MNTREALVKHLALDLLAQYGLDAWSFEFDNGKRRLGACHYNTKRITMSRPMLPNCSDAEVRETLLHEIAHAIVGGKAGHGPEFVQQLIDMGGTGARTHQVETIKGRYDVVCVNCGVIGDRHAKQGTWKRATATNGVRIHRSCRGSVYLVDRLGDKTQPVQVPTTRPRVLVAASEPSKSPEGPECLCACGNHTKGGKYLPGHDAKHVAWMASLVAVGTLTPEQALATFDLTKAAPGQGSAALHNKLVARLNKQGWTWRHETREWVKA